MNGQIHSYFDDAVPDQFFKLLSFYTGYCCISSIPFAVRWGSEEIERMRVMSNYVIEQFNNYQDYTPKWYEEP